MSLISSFLDEIEDSIKSKPCGCSGSKTLEYFNIPLKEVVVYEGDLISEEEKRGLSRDIPIYPDTEPTHSILLIDKSLEDYYIDIQKRWVVFYHCDRCGDVFKIQVDESSDKDYRTEEIEESVNLSVNIQEDKREEKESERPEKSLSEDYEESDESDITRIDQSEKSEFVPDESVFDEV